jgi:hypothetical protein
MPRLLSIKAARDIAARYELKQVILLAWDGIRTHVVACGKSEEDCDQATPGGDWMRKALGWPESMNAEPSRVQALRARLSKAEERFALLNAGMSHGDGEARMVNREPSARVEELEKAGGTP